MDDKKPKRIFWLLDEVIAETNPVHWEQVRTVSQEIIAKIGSPDIEHHIVDPIESFNRIAKQLDGSTFTCVLDLAGWLTPSLRTLLPNTEVVDSFSLSRVRVVSSPKLETTGYVMDMSQREINERRSEIDLTRPLIIDDTSFSGWTSRKTMDLWGIDPKNTTHAFLMANTGMLGDNKGAVDSLRDLGGKVIFDLDIKSPEDDSWHIKDLYQSNQLTAAIDLSIGFKQILDKYGLDSEVAKQFLNNEEVASVLFPERLTSEQIQTLINEKRFIFSNNAVLRDGEIHSRNPFLWVSPYFQAHVDMDKLGANRKEIIYDLQRLSNFANHSEGKREASFGLRQELKRFITNGDAESHFRRGVEK